ncbi:MAG: amidase [Alphaproteobacteria bacterium]
MNTSKSTATQAAQDIRQGNLSSRHLVETCLQTIKSREGEIGAWTYLDPAHALRQADAADQSRADGRSTGPLHGVPVGIKDIFDTEDMPTEDGSPLHAGRRPHHDAMAVALLRQAGAIILGKTVTTEFALYSPGKTRNPHNPAHTPGGSSSGSAAAVAAGMIPVALGSQTNGSIIRPASFCGVVGFKPSHGLISRTGVLTLSRRLDHVGVFARSVDDAALVADVLTAYDAADEDMRPAGRPNLLSTAREEPPVPPNFVFLKTPAWPFAEPDMVEAFAELRDSLGSNIHEVELPSIFDHALDAHRTVMAVEVAMNLSRDYRAGATRMSPRLRNVIAHGRRLTAQEYLRACAAAPHLSSLLDEIFDECSAILTPAAPGEAPKGVDSTGNPAFATLWTLCGLPSISLPLLQGKNGLPIGVQLVGRKGDDARLLRTARWLARHVAEIDAPGPIKRSRKRK